MIERILGPSWRTTLTGFLSAITSLLTLLAVIPYEQGGIADVFPPEWKPRLVVIGAISTFLLRWINSVQAKDAKIAGIGTQEDPIRKPTPDGCRSQTMAVKP